MLLNTDVFMLRKTDLGQCGLPVSSRFQIGVLSYVKADHSGRAV
jgi:hypothetical protein